MDGIGISLKMTVAELLRLYPQVATVFINHRTACIGCSMSGFDTLEEVARNYALDPAGLVAEIAATVTGSRISEKWGSVPK